MLGLQEIFKNSEDVSTIINGIDGKLKEQLVAGLSGSARTVLMSTIYSTIKKPQIIVTHNLFQAQKLYDDLIELNPEQEVFLYPVNELIASEIGIASPELKSQRIEVLNHWSQQQKGIIVVPVAGLRRLLPTKEKWKQSQKLIQVGDDLSIDNFLHELIALGYERSSMVSTPGEFSIRGGIIDIYPLTEELPVRIELFDTEVDSIRTFEVEDQRSKDKLDSFSFGPATEMLFEEHELQKGADRLEEGLARSLKKLKDEKLKKQFAENISREIEMIRDGQVLRQMFKYLSLFYEAPASLLDYLPEEGVIIVDEISRVQEMSETLEKEELEWSTSLLAEGEIIHDLEFSHSFFSLLHQTKKNILYMSLFLRHVPHTNPQNIVNMSCKAMQSFHGQINVLKNELERWKKAQYAVIFLGATEERVKKLDRVLADYDIDGVTIGKNDTFVKGRIQIIQGRLNDGFEFPMQKIVVITEEELFKKQTPKRSQRKQKLSNAERIKNYSELKVGDYVVHINHGIGKYLGIETLEINGNHKDYIHIKYQGNDKLYVPIDQIDQVQKYVGSEGKEPKVYKLGGTEWKKVKSKVESSVQDIAEDLIKLYAEREASRGYAFTKDGAEQQEFETSFPYQETDDQLRSIEEIKQDMERERPMDRLLCGDVGYGKTEVAIRAAFKAIMDGKQVAFLVPTTILAQQHYETIKERFQDYPIEIGLLSRFRSRKQQTETIKGIKQGTVDIVVGTHRLLSKDVQYKDIGLLIIDEEQRFGVTHKEKIKQFKANIDVLTLTATPIPRTLHMSMLGVRDLSVIETPPENRFPVQTYVMEYNGALVREAIERELARGGQVYFLYNRVEDIERKADELSMLVPDAKIIYAHGKMNENELESVMLTFLEGEADVLVSTTIIETGVDIPNVNTLIVSDADKMGLSQLYQLRGRVGRSNRIAYAYFTYKRDKVLTEVAEKRLQSIKEFTELGSGFKIAMRDLSIRGAGNLLGAQQHGFIDSVGFDLYSQMLKDAVEARKGIKEETKEVSVEIDVDLDAYLPEEYIKDGKQKIEIYKRFKGVSSMDDILELQEEMMDRFGDYPLEVDYLLKITELKVLASQAKVESIKHIKQEIVMLMTEEDTQKIKGEELFMTATQIASYINLGFENNRIKMTMPTKKLKSEEWLLTAKQLLTEIPKLLDHKSALVKK
ncbi:transcription-repair coupling factor (superfamily II helicase) [Bacillus mesophilus]|uniref:Transcription-repair-coupling factor n=1 Tax=Bacillus mesophilus TaxID=1808955 RepID=A0A6M0QCP4_9BACI|nr:transcription-repair coupling factor [Bacillus mesophilus]MBM7663426.1 transcription-repair coupling factor (superfamily II helicase) [Bacillus mesophilus]NEY74124.1 transcription-repair coupling factor [Bacillus mesophilus]